MRFTFLRLNTCIFACMILFSNLSMLEAQPREVIWLKKINGQENKRATDGFKFISKTVTPLSFAIPVSIITIGLIQNDNQTLGDGLQVGSSLILAALASTGLKYTINRKRPGEKYSFIHPRENIVDPSFPSGHTTVAFALATAVSLLYPKWYVIGPAATWAGTVAYSRLYLGVHFPSDILGGIVIGTGFSFLVWQGRKWIDQQ